MGPGSNPESDHITRGRYLTRIWKLAKFYSKFGKIRKGIYREQIYIDGKYDL